MRPANATASSRANFLAVVVAALGYFVDIFDLLLFAIVRVESLKSLGVAQEQIKSVGLWLDNYLQVTGLVLGGFFWGILGDRRGRLSVLFGSIALYSVANILNAYISDVDPNGPLGFLHPIGLGSALNQYGVLRFIAGFGLAGELGAGITLVSELVSTHRRGLATTLIATVGICGAIAAYFITRIVEWRTAFLIGGVLGVALLVLRVGVVESGLYRQLHTQQSPSRGAAWLLLYPWSRARRYLAVIVCAVPIWYTVGILVKYCDAIGASMGMPPDARPTPGLAIMWAYVGLAGGDLASGLLSQLMKSRRKVLWLFHLLTAVSIVLYCTLGTRSLWNFYACVVFVGFASGYWAVFITTAAEQFGTNLRATAATSAPNLVRWSAAASAFFWTSGEAWLGGGPDVAWKSAVLVGAVLLPLAAVAVFLMPETFGRSLDFSED